MTDPNNAKARLWWMSALRLGGILLAFIGLYLASSSAGAMAPLAAGLLLALSGAAVTLVGPRYLLRWWRR